MARKGLVSRLLGAVLGHRHQDEQPNRFQDLNIGVAGLTKPQPGFEPTRPMDQPFNLQALAAQQQGKEFDKRNTGPSSSFTAKATRPNGDVWDEYAGHRGHVGDGEITRFKDTTGNFGDDKPRTGNSPEARRAADKTFAELARQAREGANPIKLDGNIETPEQAAARIAGKKLEAAQKAGHALDWHVSETLARQSPPKDKRTRPFSGP